MPLYYLLLLACHLLMGIISAQLTTVAPAMVRYLARTQPIRQMAWETLLLSQNQRSSSKQPNLHSSLVAQPRHAWPHPRPLLMASLMDVEAAKPVIRASRPAHSDTAAL